jgi:NADPH-dependent 2,4-dienoyl-CoA reductase/sulfur reductase-like enzyme
MQLLVIGGSDAGIAAGLRARELEQAGLQLLLDHTARAIDPAGKPVTVTNQHGQQQLGDDQLTARGLAVTLVEQAPAVMPTVNVELGRLLGEELRRHDVEVVNDVTVKAIHHAAGLTVAGGPDFAASPDLVLVVVGVCPDTRLAVAAGAQTGGRGALRVDRRMRTNLPDVLAAGDCVETWHRLLEAPTYLPLGTTAHQQGRVAGEHPAQHVLRWKDITDGLEEAINSRARVANTIQGIVLNHH